MRLATLAIPLTALALGACASTVDRAAMQTRIEKDGVLTTDITVAQLEQLRPQLRLPFRLGVAPPMAGGWHSPARWTAEELEEIESWEDALKVDGIVSDVVVIPNLTVGNTGDTAASRMLAFRQAAARQGIDAVLITRVESDYSTWANPLSLLDLTVLGLWIAPGHGAEAMTVIEGAVVDVRNEFLYGAAHAEGNEKVVRPYQYIERDQVTREARLRALSDLGDKLVERTRSAVIQSVTKTP